ncbi:MAG: hypothetical protein ACUVRD_06330 [Bacteroidia bacterium]
MEKPKKRRRTLVVIDCEAMEPPGEYDLSFLEKIKRLRIWLFYREKVHYHISLNTNFSTQNFILPRYEEDVVSYLLKLVPYEIGRKPQYRQVIVLGGYSPLLESLVQFLRERSIEAQYLLLSDYYEPRKALSSQPATQEPPPKKPGEKKSTFRSHPMYQEDWEAFLNLLPTLFPQGTHVSKKEFYRAFAKKGFSLSKKVRQAKPARLFDFLVWAGILEKLPESGMYAIRSFNPSTSTEKLKISQKTDQKKA